MSRPAFLIALLALASLFFGWQTYKAWTGPLLPQRSSGPEKPPVPGEKDLPRATPAAAPVPIASITARPLFRPDRRPFTENAAVAVPRRNYEAELSRFTVLGVVMMGDTEKAIVTGKTGGREERYEVGPGDTLPGFTVREIRADGVVVAADDREFTLPLYAGAPKATGGGPLRTEVPKPAASPAPPAAGAAQPAQRPLFPGIPQPQTTPEGARPRSVPGVQPATPPAAPRQGPIPSRRRPPADHLLRGQ